jgi:hypothetical protein
VRLCHRTGFVTAPRPSPYREKDSMDFSEEMRSDEFKNKVKEMEGKGI